MLPRHPYLNTRISILAARLIPRHQFDEFIARSPERQDEDDRIPALLGQPSAGKEFVENALLLRLLEDFRVLIRPLSGADGAFLVHALHWFELANLKAIIRGKISRLDAADIQADLVDLGSFARLPVEELLRAEDAAEALRQLETTTYRDVARDARRELDDKQDTFSVEAAIDRRYLAGLLKRASSVSRVERAALLRLMGVVLDRFNLAGLLRFRFCYGLSPARSFYFLVPSPGRLPADRLQLLARQPTVEAVAEVCPPFLARCLAGAANVTEMEDRLVVQTEQVFAAALKDTAHVVARAYAYLAMREVELRRLRVILRGRRLGLAPDLIRTAARTAA